MPRDISFCGHAILDPDQLFIVPDASQDERFRTNPLVTGDPNIRFYAGAPLKVASGSALGTLCVIDSVPRNLSDAQREALATLSQAVAAQLKLRRRLSRATEYLSFYDITTGLPNDIMFEEKLAAVVPQLRQGCLLLVEVQRLNDILASGGSGAADIILKQTAQRLSAIIPPPGAILASVGKGLFAMFLPTADAAACSRFAMQLLATALGAPYALGGEQQIKCPLHLGASLFPSDGATYEVLFRAAQQALNSAHAHREILHFYNDGMGEAAARQLRLEGELRQAIDLGQLVNYYQPKIDLASGKVAAGEALVRWRHPERCPSTATTGNFTPFFHA